MAATPHNPDQTSNVPERQQREAAAPWLGWLLGPAAWALQHAIGYAMIPWLCAMGRTWPYHLLIGISVASCCFGAMGAWSAFQSARNAKDKRTGDRLYFMSFGGFVLSAGALASILVAYIGAVWLGLCTDA